jgi:hypothetical protein
MFAVHRSRGGGTHGSEGGSTHEGTATGRRWPRCAPLACKGTTPLLCGWDRGDAPSPPGPPFTTPTPSPPAVCEALDDCLREREEGQAEGVKATKNCHCVKAPGCLLMYHCWFQRAAASDNSSVKKYGEKSEREAGEERERERDRERERERDREREKEGRGEGEKRGGGGRASGLVKRCFSG